MMKSKTTRTLTSRLLCLFVLLSFSAPTSEAADPLSPSCYPELKFPGGKTSFLAGQVIKGRIKLPCDVDYLPVVITVTSDPGNVSFNYELLHKSGGSYVPIGEGHVSGTWELMSKTWQPAKAGDSFDFYVRVKPHPGVLTHQFVLHRYGSSGPKKRSTGPKRSTHALAYDSKVIQTTGRLRTR